jgi:hypothetical protein
MSVRKILIRMRHVPRHAVAIFAIVAAGTIAGGATAVAHPEPSLSVPKSAVGAKPVPHILNFARDLRGQRLKLPAGPQRVPVPWNVDGCDHGYGTVNQCVPWTIPASAGQRCPWLAAHGFGPLKVHGRDRQNLDVNHDGMACDKGDVGA